jgi:hypothetical protein
MITLSFGMIAAGRLLSGEGVAVAVGVAVFEVVVLVEVAVVVPVLRDNVKD